MNNVAGTSTPYEAGGPERRVLITSHGSAPGAQEHQWHRPQPAPAAPRTINLGQTVGGGALRLTEVARLAHGRRGFCFTREMKPHDRSRLSFMIRYAVGHPERIVPHARRLARDGVLRLRNRDHVSYYRAVMRSDAARSGEGAVGSHTHESWLKVGQMQFDYLVSHGLKPGMRMLEIGCGNLRAGRLFIEHLDAGDYYGIDISPDILLAAQRTLTEAGLQHKLPHLTLVQDLKLEFLPAGYFDVVHAHSVFSHSPIEVIDECRTEGAEHHVLREDFYYRTETLLALAGRHGLAGQFMKDWEDLSHPQSKLRISRLDELRYISIVLSDGRKLSWRRPTGAQGCRRNRGRQRTRRRRKAQPGRVA